MNGKYILYFVLLCLGALLVGVGLYLMVHSPAASIAIPRVVLPGLTHPIALYLGAATALTLFVAPWNLTIPNSPLCNDGFAWGMVKLWLVITSVGGPMFFCVMVVVTG